VANGKKRQDKEQQSQDIIVIPEEELEVFSSMLDAVPDIEDAGYEDILRQIANAESAYDLDKPFRAEGLRDYVDETIIVESIKKSESEYEGGLGVFLVVNIIREETGERETVTTGSLGVVGTLLKANAVGWLPLRCIPQERTSRKGYKPMHLKTSIPQPKQDEDPHMNNNGKGLNGEDLPF
jgi:hypothetical protein